MEVRLGTPREIDPWMELVELVRWNFPGLETAESLADHRATVLRFMERQEALFVSSGDSIDGVLLFSGKRSEICFLAVRPDCRRQGIASSLMRAALSRLDRSRAVTVSTFREEDEKGPAPRALYQKFGFLPGELVTEFDYPNQRLILPPREDV